MDVRLCVVGGELQGIEALYLAKKAGYRTILIDKKDRPPALRLADEFYKIDVVKEGDAAKRVFAGVDAILPALEKVDVLLKLEKICKSMGLPFLQDNAAFMTTSDKLKAIECFDKWGIPHPNLYPHARYPLIIKPVFGSGGRGVRLVRNRVELEESIEKFRRQGEKYLIQEYVAGSFLSLELLGFRGISRPMQITWLEFDENYSCKRVLAPCPLSREVKEKVIALGERLVEGLNLTGLTDIQPVLQGEEVKVIEANARLPSQTPTVVYQSTGLNMVELLCDLFLNERLPSFKLSREEAVIYQHITIACGRLKVVGEHYMCVPGIELRKEFFGASEALTNFFNCEGANAFVATLIVRGGSLREAKRRMERVIESIMSEYKINGLEDSSPPGVLSLYDKIDA